MSAQTEAEVLQQLLPELEAQGYDVYLRPDRRLLPAFLEGYVPDAVALRTDKNLAIEVTRRSEDVAKNLEHITSRFNDQPKWEFRVIWLEPRSSQRDIKIQTAEAIARRIAEVRELLDKGSSEGALLLAWGSFEAIGRALLPRQFQRHQTPGRLIEILAMEGYLTPSEADMLRSLAEKRNKMIHGEFQTHVSKAELQKFVIILEELLKNIN